jgi:hypothetical protein
MTQAQISRQEELSRMAKKERDSSPHEAQSVSTQTLHNSIGRATPNQDAERLPKPPSARDEVDRNCIVESGMPEGMPARRISP